MPVYDDPIDARALDAAALQQWTAAIVERIGTPPDIAADVAEVLLSSDRRGIASHGTARLPQYAALVEAGVMDPAARPTIERDRPALVLLDAHNGWGQHASRVASTSPSSGRWSFGSSTVVLRNSNHYGIAGWYALRAARQGLIGVSMTNSSPLVAPTRSRIPMLGTNPIAIAAPAGRYDAFCLDMATSTVPRGRIEVAARRGWSLPVGWAIDVDGNPATTPEAALAGALHPLGGAEETGGYKGYGLALVVDMLTGILGGRRVRAQHRVAVLDPRGPSGPGPDVHRHRPGRVGRAGRLRGAHGGPHRAAHRRTDRARRAGSGAHPGRTGSGSGAPRGAARHRHRS